jgi:thioredoxin-like negative regulator of GroEL
MHLTLTCFFVASAWDFLLPFPLLMIPLSFALGAGAGVLTGRCFTCVPELRAKTFSQLVLVVGGLALCIYVSSFGGFATFTYFLAVVGYVLMVVGRNLSHLGASGLIGFLDRQDWTPAEEKIALRPIRLLIDKENYRQALGELDALFKKHKPTYEAVLIKAKLLHHVGRVDEARAALPGLIALSSSTPQQLAVMEMLAFLDENHPEPPKSPAPGTRRIEIYHDLVLFRTNGDEVPLRKEIPPGAYEVGEIIHRNRLWLKLAGEDFGHAAICWEAILAANRPVVAPPNTGSPIDRMKRAIAIAILGKPRKQLMTESKDYFRDAKEFIRHEDWQSAVPLLQKASAADPERFEIAYRWAEAVRRTSNDATTAQIVDQVLQQSQWSKSEEDMLKQLKRPLAK